jgi:hypothetical protein
MLSLTHAAIGGAIGEQIPNPYLAFGVALVSHLILDKVPHFWSFQKNIKKIIIWSDVVFTTAFLIFLYFFHAINHASLFWGAVGGATIDFVLVLLLREKGKIAEWHTNRQPHQEKLVWLFSDLTLFIIGLSLIIIFR